MISLARCVWNQLLQLDAFRSICDATATEQSPPSNVLTCVQWDPLEPNDDYLSRLIEPFEALARNPSDVEYCTPYLDKAVCLRGIPWNPVGSQPLYHLYDIAVQTLSLSPSSSPLFKFFFVVRAS